MSRPAIPDLAIHHISISVPDVEAAIAWYGEIFGFEVDFRMDIEHISAHGAFVKRGDLRLELWQRKDCVPVPEDRRQPNLDLKNCGTKHMALTVPNLQAVLAELVGRGVEIATIQRNPAEPMLCDPDPLADDKPPAFAAFIRDPFGVLIELIDRERSR